MPNSSSIEDCKVSPCVSISVNGRHVYRHRFFFPIFSRDWELFAYVDSWRSVCVSGRSPPRHPTTPGSLTCPAGWMLSHLPSNFSQEMFLVSNITMHEIRLVSKDGQVQAFSMHKTFWVFSLEIILNRDVCLDTEDWTLGVCSVLPTPQIMAIDWNIAYCVWLTVWWTSRSQAGELHPPPGLQRESAAVEVDCPGAWFWCRASCSVQVLEGECSQ